MPNNWSKPIQDCVWEKSHCSCRCCSHIPTPNHFSSDADEQAKEIKKLHEKVRMQITNKNQWYLQQANRFRRPAAFKEGDLVWIHLRKERFPSGPHGKLKPRTDGPFKVLGRIGENAYKIELPGEYNVSANFNVADLSQYLKDDEDSRPSLF